MRAAKRIVFILFVIVVGFMSVVLNVYAEEDSSKDKATTEETMRSVELATPYAPEDVLYGDADLNGVVNVADALTDLKYVVNLVTLSEEAFLRGDVNQNGIVNVSDALFILKYIVGLTDHLPVVEEDPIIVEPEPEPPKPVETTIIKAGDLGIDVSEHQGSSINWSKVKAAGIKFVIIRGGFASQGRYLDYYFEQNYRGAKAAGLKVGAYWYSYAENTQEALWEAQRCLEVLNGRHLDLPVFYDIEDPLQRPLSSSLCIAMMKTFCQTIEAGGYDAMIYSYLNFLNEKADYSQLKQYGFWVAEWYSDLSTIAPKSGHIMSDYAYPHLLWQYYNRGSVPGISTNVDFDYAVMDYTALTDSTALSSGTPLTAPAGEAQYVPPEEFEPEGGVMGDGYRQYLEEQARSN